MITPRPYGVPTALTVVARDGYQLFLADIPYRFDGPAWRKTPDPEPFRPPRFIQPVLIDAPRDMSNARAGTITSLDPSFSATSPANTAGRNGPGPP